MLEGAVMEYAKWFIGLVAVMFISVAVVFMFKLNEVNGFQQEVNYQIERHGGLTSTIVNKDTGEVLPLPITQNGVRIDNYNDVDITQLNGYVRKGALPKLNEYAKKTYGGCLAATPDDNAECLFKEDRNNKDMQSSGFFVREIKPQDDGKGYVYFDRNITEQARYGTTIKYAITRQIGHLGNEGISYFKPAVIGESASRVRGTVDE